MLNFVYLNLKDAILIILNDHQQESNEKFHRTLGMKGGCYDIRMVFFEILNKFLIT